MTLAELQRAIADLICSKDDLSRYGAGGAEWLASRGLSTGDAKLLHGLDVSELQAFHEIQTRDRAYFIETSFPLTTRRMGWSWSEAYFAAQPYADEDLRVEAGFFVGHLARTAGDEGVTGLARFEQAKLHLLYAAPFARERAAIPRAPSRLQPAPGIAIIPSPIDLPALVEDPTAACAPRPGVALLRRDEDDITSAWIDGLVAWVLAAIAQGSKAKMRSLARTAPGRRAIREVTEAGVVR